MAKFLLFFLCNVLVFGCAPVPSMTANDGETTKISKSSPPNLETSDSEFLGQILPVTATATIESSGHTFELEVADTFAEQQLGLMYRESLADNRGMLFEFQTARPVSFWMKNCLIHLDMLFLKDGVIQAIAHNAPPCERGACPTYGTPLNIDQVIEIRGGLTEEIGLEAGDNISVDFIDS